MIKYEVILRIILTLIVIGVPLFIVGKKYSLIAITLIQKKRKQYQEEMDKKKEAQKTMDTPDKVKVEPPKENEKTAEKSKVGPIQKAKDILTKKKEKVVIHSKNSESKKEKSKTTPKQISQENNRKEEKIIEKSEEKELEKNETTPTEPPSKIDAALQQEKLQKQLETIKYSALSNKERGKLDMYEKKLIEGLALQPENKNFLKMLSNHYFDQGNYVKALTLLKKIIQDNPKDHKAVRQIGQIYREQGDVDAARVLIEKAITLKNDNPTYLISMVEIHYEHKEIKQAIKIMEQLTKLRPTNIDYLLTLGTLHEEISEPTKAEYYFMKTLEFDPLNDHAKSALRRLSI